MSMAAARWEIRAAQGRGHQLTARDIEMLRWVTRHGVVTTEHVARKFFWRPQERAIGRWAALRRLRILENLGLLLRDKPFAHHPDVMRVSGNGARLADLGIRSAPLVLAELRHTLAVVGLTEYLLAANPGAELITERELRGLRHRERQSGGRAPGSGRCPDGILRLPTRDEGESQSRVVAIELDRVRKDLRSMEAIIHGYDEELAIDVIWWYVPSTHLARITELVRALRANDRIEVKETPAWLA
jgi:hypothetical protein